MNRRQFATFALAVPALARAALFGPDVSDVELGSSTTGVLDPQSSRRLNVQTTLRTREVRWVDARGRVRDTSTETLVDNKYDWRETVERSTDIWRVTAEDLDGPAWAVLRVRSPNADELIVSLFPGAASASSLDPALGIEVMPSDDSAEEWLALFRLDPRQKTFVTVQARQAHRIAYRIAVLPAGSFQR